MCVIFFIFINSMPNSENDSSLPNIGDSINYYKLLIDPMFLVNMANISLVWVIDSYNDTTLEPYLSQVLNVMYTLNSKHNGNAKKLY